MVRDTSFQAYQDIAADLPTKQAAIVDTMIRMDRPVCNYELAQALGWPINCITPRVNELLKTQILIDTGKRPGPPAGRNVHFWRLRSITTTLF